jgi:hypothetical protein
VLSDLELLRRCRIVPTSLLRLNLEYLPRTGRFLRAEALNPSCGKEVIAGTKLDRLLLPNRIGSSTN